LRGRAGATVVVANIIVFPCLLAPSLAGWLAGWKAGCEIILFCLPPSLAPIATPFS